MRFAILLPALLSVLASSNIRAAEKTKTFPQYQCRYTLPGDDWYWDPKPDWRPFCSARHPDGRILMLAVFDVSDGTVIDDQFAADWDAHSRLIVKRGASMITFRGIRWYELRGVIYGRTIVVRQGVANGRGYEIQLIGNTDPVETRPDFETIMNRFEFTSPPVAPAATSRVKLAAQDLIEYVLDMVICALIVGTFLALGVRCFRNSDKRVR